MKNPILPEHEKRFDEFMAKWQAIMGLQGWRLGRQAVKSKYMAEIYEINDEDRLVKYRLGKDFGDCPVNDTTLESTAIHECAHVLLHPLIKAAFTSGEYSDKVRAEEHAVIVTLERILSEVADYVRELNANSSHTRCAVKAR